MLPPDIKAVIFDIDGTLLDSLEAWSDADKVFLEENGKRYDPEISAKLKSLHYISATKYLVEEFSLDMTVEYASKRIDEIIRHKYFYEIQPKENAVSYMRSCHENGLKLCAATSNLRTLAEGALSSAGMLPLLDFIITSDEVGSGKEDPEIFFRCAEKLGTTPFETAVFEDSVHAVKTAAAAGFYTVGVYDSHCSEDFPEIEKYSDISVKCLPCIETGSRRQEAGKK